MNAQKESGPAPEDYGTVFAEVERLHPQSFGWALSCCRRDRSEAEEVLQVTYMKILDGSARFSARSGFMTWLFAVIRLTALERRRRAFLQWEMGAATAQIERELEGPRVDEAKAVDISQRITTVEGEIKRAHLAMLIRIKNLLDEDQQRRLNELRQASAAPRR